MENIKTLAAMLSQVEHFRELNSAEISAIVASGSVRHLPGGSFVFYEGEPCAGLFVLLQGRIHLQKTGLDGKHAIMRVINPVYMFNEVAVLDGGPNPATAVAAIDSNAWHISRDGFQKVILRFPQIGLGLLRILAAHNRHLVDQYEDLTTRPVVARCAKLLYELSQAGSQPVNRRHHPAHEMAARIATVPELLSRALKTLKENGIIETTSQLITVINPEQLAGLARILR